MNQEKPNMIIDKQQLSEEELQRTQVLNLDDFRSVARIEKIGSKKPAIIVALIGAFSIIAGTAFPAIQSYNARKKAEQEGHVIVARKEDDEDTTSQLVCTYESIVQESGYKETYEKRYTFEDDKLVSLEKEVQVTAIVESANQFIAYYKNVLMGYLVETGGYSLTIKDVPNGVSTVAKINYESLDKTLIPQQNETNIRFGSEYEKGTTKEKVKSTNETAGFICRRK